MKEKLSSYEHGEIRIEIYKAARECFRKSGKGLFYGTLIGIIGSLYPFARDIADNKEISRRKAMELFASEFQFALATISFGVGGFSGYKIAESIAEKEYVAKIQELKEKHPEQVALIDDFAKLAYRETMLGNRERLYRKL